MSEHDFGDLFGSEDEASDIDDGRVASPLASEGSIEPQRPSQPSDSKEAHNTDNLDHLFGSEEEEEEEESFGRIQNKQRLHRRRAYDVDQSSEEEGAAEEEEEKKDNDYQGRGEEEFIADEEPAPRLEPVEVDISMPTLPLPTSADHQYALVKLPRYLDVDIQSFDRDTFEIQTEGMTEEERQNVIRQQIRTTMRWRRRQDEQGKHVLDSNTHLVEWEDGTMSLMIGDECFDITRRTIDPSDPMFLFAHQAEAGVLESHVELTDHMTLRLSDIHSEAHRLLASQLTSAHTKTTKVKALNEFVDGSKEREEMERQATERLRAQRKLEQARRRAEAQYDRGMGTRRRRGDFDTYDDYPSLSRSSHLDEYEDDFVVDDEDEEAEKAREDRLAQVKRRGMDKYRRRETDMDVDEEEEEDEDFDDEEEEEEEEEEEVDGVDAEDDMEEDDEVVVRRRPRSRPVLSDEDD